METIVMRDRSLASTITVAIATAVSAFISMSSAGTSAQAPIPILKTTWGEPDLQGIWTDETDTPLQRPARYATQEFFTAAQREELDREPSSLLRRDKAWSAAPNSMSPA